MFMTNFAMSFNHKYSLTEIEGLMPWERDVYVRMITEYIREENEAAAQKEKVRK